MAERSVAELCRVVRAANEATDPKSFDIMTKLNCDNCRRLYNSDFTRGMFVDIAVLSGVLKLDYGMEVCWNMSPSCQYVKELSTLGCVDKNGMFNKNKLESMGMSLCNWFGMLPREVENVLCEVFRGRNPVDVYFFEQDVYNVRSHNGKKQFWINEWHNGEWNQMIHEVIGEWEEV